MEKKWLNILLAIMISGIIVSLIATYTFSLALTPYKEVNEYIGERFEIGLISLMDPLPNFPSLQILFLVLGINYIVEFFLLSVVFYFGIDKLRKRKKC